MICEEFGFAETDRDVNEIVTEMILQKKYGAKAR